MKKHILHFLMILLVVGMLADCDTPATAAPQPTNTPSAVTVETAAPTETPAEVSSEAAPLWSISPTACITKSVCEKDCAI